MARATGINTLCAQYSMAITTTPTMIPVSSTMGRWEVLVSARRVMNAIPFRGVEHWAMRSHEVEEQTSCLQNHGDGGRSGRTGDHNLLGRNGRRRRNHLCPAHGRDDEMGKAHLRRAVPA